MLRYVILGLVLMGFVGFFVKPAHAQQPSVKQWMCEHDGMKLTLAMNTDGSVTLNGLGETLKFKPTQKSEGKETADASQKPLEQGDTFESGGIRIKLERALIRTLQWKRPKNMLSAEDATSEFIIFVVSVENISKGMIVDRPLNHPKGKDEFGNKLNGQSLRYDPEKNGWNVSGMERVPKSTYELQSDFYFSHSLKPGEKAILVFSFVDPPIPGSSEFVATADLTVDNKGTRIPVSFVCSRETPQATQEAQAVPGSGSHERR